MLILPHLIVAGGVLAVFAVAKRAQGEAEQRREEVWHEARAALGGSCRYTYFGGEEHGLEGVLEGARFSAHGHVHREDGNIELTCHVTVDVAFPLPAGMVIVSRFTDLSVNPSDGGSVAVGLRPLALTHGDFHVRCDVAADGRAFASRVGLRPWLDEMNRQPGSVSLQGNRVTVRHVPFSSAIELEAVVRRVVAHAQRLAEAAHWQPSRERALALDGRTLTAFDSAPRAEAAREQVSLDGAEPGGGGEADGGLMGRLIGRLEGEGTRDGAGTFTMDAEAALRKLRASRVSRSGVFVLELLRAASLRGATRIHIAVGTRSLSVRFDGATYTTEELRDMFSAALSSDPDPRVQSRRHLALGIEGAMTTDPVRVEVRTPKAIFRREADGGDQVLRPIDADASRSSDNELTFTLPLLRGMTDTAFSTAVGLARRHAQFLRAQVSIAGEPLRQGLPGWNPDTFRDFEVPGPSGPVRGHLGFVFGADALGSKSAAWLGHADVWVERWALDAAPPGLRVVVMGHDVGTDLSGERVVRGDGLERVLAQIDDEVPALVMDMITGLETHRFTDVERARRIARHVRGVCDTVLSWETLRHAAALELGTLEHALVNAPAWPTADGELRSLRTIHTRAARDGGGKVPYVLAAAPELVRGGWCEHETLVSALGLRVPDYALDVPRLSAADRRFIAAVYGDALEDHTAALLTAVRP